MVAAQARTVSSLGRSVLDLDVSKTTTETTAKALSRLPSPVRETLLRRVRTLLRSGPGSPERERLATAKILVALLPASFATIQDCLRRRDSRRAYELHFSLFCFLDDARYVPQSNATLRKLNDMVVSYLYHAKSDAANAAWMAVHLLATHWPGKQSLKGLSFVALQSSHPVARSAALMGIGECLPSLTKTERLKIARLLETIQRSDRRPKIRRQAARIIAKLSSP